MSQKGFTLIELLIVIGILAILSTAMVLVINPAELLRRSRDTQRLSDLSTLKTAIGYYLVNVSTPYIGGSSTNDTCVGGTTPTLWATVFGVSAGTFTFSYSTTSVSKIDGSGWVPIDFTHLTGGSPIGSLPLDPSNTSATSTPSLYYTYVCNKDNLTFEMTANMESDYYKKGGTNDVESKDGGDIDTLYESGTELTIGPTSTTANFYPGA